MTHAKKLYYLNVVRPVCSKSRFGKKATFQQAASEIEVQSNNKVAIHNKWFLKTHHTSNITDY